LLTHLPKLSFQIFCSAASDATFRLVASDSGGGRVVALQPPHSGRWQTLVVNAPQNPFVLEIKNQNTNSPVAVGEIKELGRFSVLTQNLLGHAVLVLSDGLCLCIFLAGAALSRPGISFANEGLAWLLILLSGLTALFGVWCWRNFDSTEYSCTLHKKWAAEFTSVGHPGRAELHLHEALWLQPDDAEARKELASSRHAHQRIVAGKIK